MSVRSGMVTFHDEVQDKLVAIDSVRPHPDNYNNGDVEKIMDSIVTNGMYRPVVVQRSTGFVLAGNHTWMACKELDSEHIPVTYLDVDDVTAKKIIVADNEIARQAKPDRGLLQALLDDINSHDSLVGTGFNAAELEALRALNDIPAEDTSDHMQWPTLCFQLPPHAKKAFYDLTEQAGGDNERFALLIRLAGWDGKR